MRRNQKPYNQKSTLISGIIFSVALPPLFFIFIRDDVPLIFAPILSAICIAYFVYTYLRGKKRRDIDISEVEDSYDNGKLLTYKKCGINIGTAFLVIYNETKIDVLKISGIRSVTRHITRLKKYEGTLYAGEEYLHKVRIIADKEYLAELNEYQVEMAVNELNRFVNVHDPANISENYNNQIV